MLITAPPQNTEMVVNTTSWPWETQTCREDTVKCLLPLNLSHMFASHHRQNLLSCEETRTPNHRSFNRNIKHVSSTIVMDVSWVSRSSTDLHWALRLFLHRTSSPNLKNSWGESQDLKWSVWEWCSLTCSASPSASTISTVKLRGSPEEGGAIPVWDVPSSSCLQQRDADKGPRQTRVKTCPWIRFWTDFAPASALNPTQQRPARVRHVHECRAA